MSDDATKKDERHRGGSHTSPYPVSRLAPPHGLVDLAREIEAADHMLGAVTESKLQVIADQMRQLKDQAVAVLAEARRDLELHHAECSFQKRPGKLYHLYQRPGGATYLSMLTPEDWGGEPPHQFLGTYRLENDMSWTPEEALDARGRKQDLVRKLLG